VSEGRTTPRQREFARAYLATGNAAEAARAAGYHGVHARQAGYKFLRRPTVQVLLWDAVDHSWLVGRVTLRRVLLRALRRLAGAVLRGRVSLYALVGAGQHVHDAMAQLGLGADPAGQQLRASLATERARLRQLATLEERLFRWADETIDRRQEATWELMRRLGYR
jgi:hypothetical protein